MTIISSCFILFAMIICGFIVENYVSGGYILSSGKVHFIESWKRTAQVNGPHNVVRIIVPAVFTAAMYYFATAMSQIWWLNAIFTILIAGVYVVYAKWFVDGVTEWKEWLFFQPLFIIPFIVLLTVTKNIAAVVKSSFWTSVLYPFAPWAVITFVIIGALVLFLRKRANEHENARESERAKKERVFSVIIAILLVIALVLESIFLIAWPKSNGGNQPTPAAWPYFYNIELQTDNDEGNDFNFGSNPYHKNWSAEDYDANFRYRMTRDPALGAADIAYFDAIVGTPYLGEFYQSCKQDWAKAINAAKVGWINDHNAYQKTLIAFFACLDKADVSIVESGKQIVDQMYMNSYTSDMVPVVIVMKTKQQEGPFLVYTLTIKGNTFVVAYRIPCGYQPTNVQLVMGIKPQPEPDKTATGGGKGGGGSKTTTNPARQPTTDQQPTTNQYVKDPKRSTAVGNDVRGPGEDTNSGGNSSTKDRSTNSNHMSSYEKYVQDMERNNREANTTTAPSSSYSGNRDSNEGEASKPTPTKPKPSETATDPPAQQWSGPSD